MAWQSWAWFFSIPAWASHLLPGAMVELDEPDPALDQPARQETEPAERGRGLLVEAVEGLGRQGLPREVDGLGRFGLHPEGQLVAGDPRFELGLFGVLARVLVVEPGQEVELAALLGVGEPGRGVEVRDRLGAPWRRTPWKTAGMNPAPQFLGPLTTEGRVVLHDHERRQVLVHGAEAVADPTPQRRAAAEDRAGVHLADARGMVDAVGPAGANDGDVVDAAGRVRQPIRNPGPALTVLLPGAPRLQQRLPASPIAVMTLPKLAGIGLPASLLSSGLGSKRSMWLGPLP